MGEERVAGGGIDEEARKRFEESQGAAPIEEFLPPRGDPRYLETLEELVCIDLEFRWRHADGSANGVLIEAYLERFQALAQADLLQRLLSEEYLLRHQFGDRPSPESFSERFPELRCDGGDIATCLKTTMLPEELLPTERKRRSLGRYDLLEEVGRGSFARVYRAHDPSLERTVAVKVLRSVYLDDPTLVARVYREARSAASLRHPGIIPVHEVSEEDGCPFIVTDFIGGGSLEDQLADRSPAPADAARQIAHIADALHYAHLCGVVHRDVKPANVLVTEAGDLLVSDFGLAAHADAGVKLTVEGDLIGTPAYMSPEQARGGHQVDGRSDIYSLGVMLYQMLCGGLPFDGNWSMVIQQVMTKEPTPPRRLRASVPIELETICLKAMAREPERRYQTAGELAEDLRRYLNRMPILARRPGAFSRGVLWARRNPALATTISIAIVVLFVVSAVAFRSVMKERDRFLQERDVARSHLYRALLGEAKAQAEVRDTGWWWKVMENVREAAELAAGPEDRATLRDLAVRFMGISTPRIRLHAEWPQHQTAITAVAVAPDGKVGAASAADGSVRLFSLPDGEPLGSLPENSGSVTGLAFDAAGRRLATATTEGAITFWTVLPQPRREGVRWVGESIMSLAVTRDGKRLAAACGDGTIRLLTRFDAATEPRIMAGHADWVKDVSFSRSGRFLASVGQDGMLRTWDALTGEPRANCAVGDAIGPVAFHGNEEDLVVAFPNGYRFDRFSVGRHAGRPVPPGQLHAEEVTELLIDGRDRVVSASRDGTIKVWQGDQQVAIGRGDFGPCTALRFGEAEHWLVAGYLDGTVRTFEYREPDQHLRFGSQHDVVMLDEARLATDAGIFDCREPSVLGAAWRAPDPVTALAFRFDDTRLAVGDGGGNVSVRSLAKEGLVASWPGGGSLISAIAFAADGRLAWGDESGLVRIGLPGSGELPHDLSPEIGVVQSLEFAPGGDRLLVSGRTAVAVIRDLAGEPTTQLLRRRVLARGEARFVGGLVAAGTSEGLIELIDPDSKETVRTLKGHVGAVTALLVTPNGTTLYSASADQTVRAFDLASGKETVRFDCSPEMTWLSLDPTGELLLAGSHRRARPHIFDLKSRSLLALVDHGFTPTGLMQEGFALLGTQSGSIVVVSVPEARKKREEALAEVEDPTLASQVTISFMGWLVEGNHDAHVWGCAASPDGRLVATCDHQGTIKIRDSRTREMLRSMHCADGLSWGLAFSPDGKLLASGSGRIFLWDVATGEPLSVLQGHDRLVVSLAFAPGGEFLASASLDGSVRLWRMPGGAEVGALLISQRNFHEVAISADGKLLAAACGDGRLFLWDTSDARFREFLAGRSEVPPMPRALPQGDSCAVWSVAFDPTGEKLASAGEDGRILLRDLKSFGILATLRSDYATLRSLSFSTDGNLLAVGSLGHGAMVWDLLRIEETLEEMHLGW